MKVYLLEREQVVRAPAERVFEFFSNAENLAAITPGFVGFEILSPTPIEMCEGALIEYRLRLAGVPLRWRTRVTSWEPDHAFVDVQESGPYALWEHSHGFEPTPNGIRVTDRVRYALPFGPLGRLAGFWVHPTLARIFEFRSAAIGRLLEGSEAT